MKKKKTTKKRATTDTNITAVDKHMIDRVFVALLDVAVDRAYLDVSTAKKFGVDDGEARWMFDDSKALAQIAYLIQGGSLATIKEAYKMAKGLDTAVRDDVPDVFWELAEMVGVK